MVLFLLILLIYLLLIDLTNYAKGSYLLWRRWMFGRGIHGIRFRGTGAESDGEEACPKMSGDAPQAGNSGSRLGGGGESKRVGESSFCHTPTTIQE